MFAVTYKHSLAIIEKLSKKESELVTGSMFVVNLFKFILVFCEEFKYTSFFLQNISTLSVVYTNNLYFAMDYKKHYCL